jgi:hypothetical protein
MCPLGANSVMVMRGHDECGGEREGCCSPRGLFGKIQRTLVDRLEQRRIRKEEESGYIYKSRIRVIILAMSSPQSICANIASTSSCPAANADASGA